MSSGQQREAPAEPGATKGARSSARPEGAKRDEIINVATDYFGRQGYEDTKWADVAAAVGVGSTALYHYFESSSTAST